jgi:hypothetical protein
MSDATGAGVRGNLPKAQPGIGVVDRGMAKSALNADGPQRPRRVEETRHTYDGIQFEQRKRDRWVVEIDFPFLNLLDKVAGECIDVHFQAHGQGSRWTHSRANSAKSGTFNGSMKL